MAVRWEERAVRFSLGNGWTLSIQSCPPVLPTRPHENCKTSEMVLWAWWGTCGQMWCRSAKLTPHREAGDAMEVKVATSWQRQAELGKAEDACEDRSRQRPPGAPQCQPSRFVESNERPNARQGREVGAEKGVLAPQLCRDDQAAL